jgi:hypothetical protein
MEDNFERFGEQVKDITDDMFQRAIQQQEGLNKNLQEEMNALLQLMEVKRIIVVQQGTGGPKKIKKRFEEEISLVPHTLKVTG